MFATITNGKNAMTDTAKDIKGISHVPVSIDSHVGTIFNHDDRDGKNVISVLLVRKDGSWACYELEDHVGKIIRPDSEDDG